MSKSTQNIYTKIGAFKNKEKYYSNLRCINFLFCCVKISKNIITVWITRSSIVIFNKNIKAIIENILVSRPLANRKIILKNVGRPVDKNVLYLREARWRSPFISLFIYLICYLQSIKGIVLWLIYIGYLKK